MAWETVRDLVETTGAGGEDGRVGAGVDRAEFVAEGFADGGGRRTWTVYPASPLRSTTGAEMPLTGDSMSANLQGEKSIMSDRSGDGFL